VHLIGVGTGVNVTKTWEHGTEGRVEALLRDDINLTHDAFEQIVSQANDELAPHRKLMEDEVSRLAFLFWPRVRWAVDYLHERTTLKWNQTWPAGASCEDLVRNILGDEPGRIPALFYDLPYDGIISDGRSSPDFGFAKAFLLGLEEHLSARKMFTSKASVTRLLSLLPHPATIVKSTGNPAVFEELGVLLICTLSTALLGVDADLPTSRVPSQFAQMLTDAREAGVKEVRYVRAEERAFPFDFNVDLNAIDYKLREEFICMVQRAWKANEMLILYTGGVSDHRLDLYTFTPSLGHLNVGGYDCKSAYRSKPKGAGNEAKPQLVAGLGHVLRLWEAERRTRIDLPVMKVAIAAVILAESERTSMSIDGPNNESKEAFIALKGTEPEECQCVCSTANQQSSRHFPTFCPHPTSSPPCQRNPPRQKPPISAQWQCLTDTPEAR
jgi:hypothetical protein